jgi:ABC-2 type transport system permease protein
MTSRSLTSIVERGDLIRKIRIPRWIIVISASISALINLALNLVVIGVFLTLNEVDISWNIILLPLSLLEVYVFALGISFFLAAAFVRFRDLGNIWEILIQAGFYMTPILYPLTLITNETFQKILLLNPMAQAIQDARYNTITKESITAWNLNSSWKAFIPLIIVVLVLILGILYFKKESAKFAENI